MATHSVFLPGEFHGQRSLAGYGPWDRKEGDTTKWLTLSLSLWWVTQGTHIILLLYPRCFLVLILDFCGKKTVLCTHWFLCYFLLGCIFFLFKKSFTFYNTNTCWLLKIINFTFGFAGSSLLHSGFSSCGEQGLLRSRSAWASHCDSSSCREQALRRKGFSSCGTRA